MRRYRVEWTIAVEAESPVQAALAARKRQLDPESTDTEFQVTDYEEFVTDTICTRTSEEYQRAIAEQPGKSEVKK